MKKTTLSKFIAICIFCSSTTGIAQESSLFSNLDYPELQVAPRATERLAQLAALEEDQGLLLHWTMIASGLSTFTAGAMHSGKFKENISDTQKQESRYASTTAMGIGAGWVAVGGFFTYKKWASNRLNDIKKIPGKDKRAELGRERMAEESLAMASDTLGTLKYLSVATNFLASAYVAEHTPDNNRVYPAIAIAASLLPLFFPNQYETAWEKQQEYKKKIYAPFVSWNLDKDLQPQLSLTWNY